jgi:hypothetical protein
MKRIDQRPKKPERSSDPKRYDNNAAPAPVMTASVATVPNMPGCTKKSTTLVVNPRTAEMIHLLRAREK